MAAHYNSDVEALNDLVIKYKQLREEIAKVIIGQDEVVRDVLISIFSQGHCLLVGVPGLAKTLGSQYARYTEMTAANVIIVESTIFRLLPELSNVPPAIAAVDPGFWTPKPRPAPAKPKPTGN